MSEETPVTKAHDVQESSTSTPDALSHADVMLFIIGLRILGEERQTRYLTYLRQLREARQQEEGTIKLETLRSTKN